MRSMPDKNEFGQWDILPVAVKNNDSSLSDMVFRRDGLAQQHKINLKNPCVLGRNWALRQNYEGYCALNNQIKLRNT